jgi:ribosomal protein L35
MNLFLWGLVKEFEYNKNHILHDVRSMHHRHLQIKSAWFSAKDVKNINADGKN